MPDIHNKLEYKLMGNGRLTIVFFNGFRMSYQNWNKVFPEIAKKYRVLLFNRAGIGRSLKADREQSGLVIINDIQTLIKGLKLEGPFIIVAHSLGGVFANLYIRKFPKNICAVIFVDSAYPDEIIEHKADRSFSVLRLINNGIKFLEKLVYKYKYSEDEMIETTLEEISAADPFPKIIVRVISATIRMPFVPERAFEVHQKYQCEFLNLSPNSKQDFFEYSGHFPQLTESEKLIKIISDTAIMALNNESFENEFYK